MLATHPRAAMAVALSSLCLCAATVQGDDEPKAKPKDNVVKALRRTTPMGPGPAVTPVERLRKPKGFEVELVYAVPREDQGSWVSLTIDPKGRLIASDQYGKLYRITPSPVGGASAETVVEPIAVDIGEAQGLLWAFDSLYVVVNRGAKYPSGLYRARDTDGDDKLDSVEMLRKLDGGGEHGPHAVLLAPDGKAIYVLAGNNTKLTELEGSRVPRVWGEDSLLPRMVDGRGFMRDEKAPGGCIYRVDPDGKSWELVSMGYRNPYDMAFHRDGDLFTYDSDMEWDMNTPWYRPTRVCDAVSGSDFGYRNGAGKFPTYYIDSLPPTVNVGPGSPTGVAFGYGAKFPAKYQEALFICDWSYGKLYAVHLKPAGASYTGELEEFIAGAPLPLTDILVRPQDGALYFAIGGRRTTSGLYRVRYVGDEPTSPSAPKGPDAGAGARARRRMLEAFHGRRDDRAVAAAWPFLSDPDRFLRFAARAAIESQDPSSWRDKALAETNPQAALEGLLALARVSAQDPAHRSPSDPPLNPSLRGRILEALDRLDWDKLSYAQKLDLLRVYQVVLHRMGRPDEATCSRLVARFDAPYPAKGRELNVELCNLLVYLHAPDVAAKTLDLIAKAPTQEEQLDYARALRVLRTGWTPALRRAFFSWMAERASGFTGGASFAGFLKFIRDDAIATLDEAEKADLKPILEAPARAPKQAQPAAPPRPFVKEWTLDELVPIAEEGLKRKRDFDRGRSLFAAASCFSCHRFNNEGGAAGPDLTGVSGRFGVRDLLESIILPSKVISDQYEAIVVATTDGRVVTGRIMNLHGDGMVINTNMLDPSAQVSIDRTKIEEVKPSPTSMMPQGLLNTLDRDEVLDLLAYLLSRGDRDNPMFR
jgi:putative heme-binding domain-containing protein